MTSQDTPTSSPDYSRGLPPVTPPSGRFIAQLFVVPGLIVFIAVTIFAAFYYLFSPQTGFTPEYFLGRLDNPNAELRWRAASDLAQILKRPEAGSLKWKADPSFALEIADRLKLALDELPAKESEIEKSLPSLQPENRDLAWRKLQTHRDHIRFLAAALGDFHVPVGAPLLGEIVERSKSPDLQGNTLQRRQALWALSNLGENTRNFKKLTADQQAKILESLHKQLDAVENSKDPTRLQRVPWIKTALAYLDQNERRTDAVTVDAILAKIAKDDDRFIRELTAHSFNYWPGPLAEQTLLELTRDDGHGTLLEIKENER